MRLALCVKVLDDREVYGCNKGEMDFYSSLDSRTLDAETPTLFEIISSNQLNALLTPTLRHVLVHYAQRYPRYLLQVVNRFDEINFGLRFLVEYTTLKNWNASFIEKFYGIKRVNRTIPLEKTRNAVSSFVEERRRLTNAQIIACALSLTGLPLVKDKLDVLFDKLYPKLLLNNLKPQESWNHYIKYHFLKVYPVAVLTLRLLDLLCQVLYMGGKTRSASLVSFLLKLNYARLSGYDYRLAERRNSPMARADTARVRPPSVDESLAKVMKRGISPLRKTVSAASTTLFPAAIFLLKFLEWWNTSGFSEQFSKSSQQLSNIEPPCVVPKGDIRNNTSSCPLCRQEINNPTVLETGYVFCYTCINRFLQEQEKSTGGRCPITGKVLLHARYEDSQWTVHDCLRRVLF